MQEIKMNSMLTNLLTLCKRQLFQRSSLPQLVKKLPLSVESTLYSHELVDGVYSKTVESSPYHHNLLSNYPQLGHPNVVCPRFPTKFAYNFLGSLIPRQFTAPLFDSPNCIW